MIVNVLTDDKTTVQVLQSSLPNVIEVVAIGPQGPAGSAGAGDSIDTGSFATTSSLQDLIDVTGSFATTSSLQGLIDVTGSFATTSSLQEIINTTGSFATTGSNSFVGSQVITGSLTVSGSSTFINIGPTVLSGSVTSTQGFTGSLQGTASIALTASFAQGYVLNSNTASFVRNFQTSSFATTGSNTFTGNQTVTGTVSASYFDGDGRYVDNLSATTAWNYNQEYLVKKTEQLTFSGDYILENSYLQIQGDVTASIGEWTEVIFTEGRLGSITRTSNNTYTLITPHEGTNTTDGVQIKRLFDTNTTMSVQYVWNGEDVGNDRPYYEVGTQDPTEPNSTSRLRNTNAISESGTWTINVPSGSWVAIGVWTDNNNATSGSLQVTLPYLPNEDLVQYSPNKYFKKEGTLYVGGNLLLKDSYIENNGQISVGGEVILIGNSQIEGTGTII